MRFSAAIVAAAGMPPTPITGTSSTRARRRAAWAGCRSAAPVRWGGTPTCRPGRPAAPGAPGPTRKGGTAGSSAGPGAAATQRRVHLRRGVGQHGRARAARAVQVVRARQSPRRVRTGPSGAGTAPSTAPRSTGAPRRPAPGTTGGPARRPACPHRWPGRGRCRALGRRAVRVRHIAGWPGRRGPALAVHPDVHGAAHGPLQGDVVPGAVEQVDACRARGPGRPGAVLHAEGQPAVEVTEAPKSRPSALRPGQRSRSTSARPVIHV